ncbi:Ribulosamine/erythrulosamine 3-kinase potentially involved in protein deglycation [hydrothermal vent metagenome]|uniref:Ribulosamine/erythrulosamine 3-kinase potentially involved in protein deglycation n=1 Tax=hydrothermal vent metagenome TaxID=652676 RepID=A0A3B0WKI3_9ZZZZ
MNWQALSKSMNTQLTQQNLPTIQIITAHAIQGGDTHQAYQLHSGKQNYFLKLAPAHNLSILQAELHNLQAIKQSNTLNCPPPYAAGIHQEHAWLLMEFITLNKQGDDIQRGRDLAFMHHHIHHTPDTLKPFGWFEDNFIGRTRQSNIWSSDWISFYGQQRLQPQFEMSQLNGAPKSLYQSGQALIERLPLWFQDYQPKPSLLHGDLWSGNSAFNTEGDPVFFDPACYYGDRETDIAMTELFSGFSSDFYNGYQEIFPLDSGYQNRKTLYNLYHTLNHFNLFGGSYLQQAQQTIQQLLQESTSK